LKLISCTSPSHKLTSKTSKLISLDKNVVFFIEQSVTIVFNFGKLLSVSNKFLQGLPKLSKYSKFLKLTKRGMS